MTIYKQFDAATANFDAKALILNGAVVGRIVVKYGAAATAYVQVWGAEMTTGRATGGGYDRTTAAVAAAVERLDNVERPSGHDADAFEAFNRIRKAFKTASDGARYTSTLEGAGFIIANVI